jgi:hypothetical protein
MAVTVGNVGAYRVTGEEPDNQAETGCTNGECNLLVCHGDRITAFAYLTISSLPKGILVAKRMGDTPPRGKPDSKPLSER